MSGFPKLPDGAQLSVGSHKVTIVRYLSEGGFAHIYEVQIATDDKKGRVGCLKRVIVPDKGGLNQLRKEVDVMKTLRRSRSIVQYFDSHAERLDNGTYQVLVLMELCPNKSLLDYMNAKIKTKLTEPEILKIMKDIGIGVFEMHKKYLIHRDIKIENVLIDAKHNFKLCDFGSTSAPVPPPADQHQMRALAHDIMYQTTPQYRSPEMIDLYRGFPIDQKADIWALGCFLYKLCYYTTPFEAHGDIAILHASFQFPPAPPYSGDLKNLIIIMLQENPVMRPTIVQVLMLVAKMLHVDFAEWKIEDIYATGEYNFHALSEYQRQRQEEMMKQQQMYYQQQNWKPDQHNQQQLNPYNQYKPGQPAQKVHGHLIPQKSKLPSQEEPGQVIQAMPDTVEELDKQHSSSSSDSFPEIADLDNINERYPSVENLLADINSEKPLERSSREGTDKTGELHKSYGSRALSKHSVEENSRSHIPTASPSEPHSNLYQEPSQTKSKHKLDNKEAWETHKSYIDKNAEQLADDIFARPHSTIPNQESRKSTELQRTVSEGAAVQASNYDLEHDFVNDYIDQEPEPEESTTQGLGPVQGQAKVPAQGPVHSQVQGQAQGQGPVQGQVHDQVQGQIQGQVQGQGPGQVQGQSKGPKPEEKQPELGAGYLPSLVPNTISVNPVPLTNMAPLQASPEMQSMNYFSPAHEPTRVPSLSHHSHYSSTIGSSYEKEAPPLPTRKSANPWGSYTLPKVDKPDEAQFEALQISTPKEHEMRLAKHQSKGSAAESNLIDLEVGLESSSSSISGPEVMDGRDLHLAQGPSLIDFDIEETPLPDKPHFKKRISSAQAPASMSLQEEVIDFASDDENPDNQSNMNRLSIRNSLSKKRAKEHRKS